MGQSTADRCHACHLLLGWQESGLDPDEGGTHADDTSFRDAIWGREGSMYECKGWETDFGTRGRYKVRWKREGKEAQGKSLLWFIYSDGRNTDDTHSTCLSSDGAKRWSTLLLDIAQELLRSDRVTTHRKLEP